MKNMKVLYQYQILLKKKNKKKTSYLISAEDDQDFLQKIQSKDPSSGSTRQRSDSLQDKKQAKTQPNETTSSVTTDDIPVVHEKEQPKQTSTKPAESTSSRHKLGNEKGSKTNKSEVNIDAAAGLKQKTPRTEAAGPAPAPGANENVLSNFFYKFIK